MKASYAGMCRCQKFYSNLLMDITMHICPLWYVLNQINSKCKKCVHVNGATENIELKIIFLWAYRESKHR